MTTSVRVAGPQGGEQRVERGSWRLPAEREGRLRWAVGAVLVAAGVVLRWWDLGRPLLTFDEAFTQLYSRLGPADLFPALERNDSHPPLDYLIRHPFSDAGTFLLRAPSAAMSTVTLLVVVAWMRGRGWFGVAVVGFTSVSAFQLVYAHQARMYALGVLAGTCAAMSADRWRSGDTRSRWLVVVGVSVAGGLLAQSSFGVLVPFVLLVVGFWRGREAWRWRGAVVIGGLVWAVVWGARFATQVQTSRATWIPYTTPSGVLDAVNGFLTLYSWTTPLTALIVVLGGVLLWRRRDALGWTALLLAGGPLLVVAVLGIWSHLLLTRTLAFSAWCIPLVIAAIIDAARQRSTVLGIALAGVFATLVLSSIGPAIAQGDPGPGRVLLAEEVQPGDAVIVHPPWLWPLIASDLGTAPDTRVVPGSVEGPQIPSALQGRSDYVDVVGDAPFTGRVWLFMPDTYGFDADGLEPCPDPVPRPDGHMVIRCYTVPTAP